MYYIHMEYDWDLDKEKKNLKKHKISFKQAMSSFDDIDGFSIDDPNHSTIEKRYF